VRSACLVLRSLQAELRAHDDVHRKGDASPVTVGDLAAQALIALEIGEPIVGEESSDVFETRPELLPRVLEVARRARPGLNESTLLEGLRLGEGEPGPGGFWTLDPIDGTKGFLRGGQYCVSLAWIEAGAPTLGVLGCPRLGADALDGDGALAWAVEGHAPLLSGLDEDGTARRLEAPPSPDSAVRIAESVESSHSDHDLGPRLLEAARLAAGPPLRLDSQVKYAVVARGDAQVFIRRPKRGYVERIWDHAAGSLVARAAGCRVSDLDGEPLDFSLGRGLERNRGLLVARPELHERLLEAVVALGA
jgi:3'(2'), 5'-bisphosphate nucleotidase